MKSSRRETLTGGGVTRPGPHRVSSAVAKGRLPRGVFVLERGVSVILRLLCRQTGLELEIKAGHQFPARLLYVVNIAICHSHNPQLTCQCML